MLTLTLCRGFEGRGELERIIIDLIGRVYGQKVRGVYMLLEKK